MRGEGYSIVTRQDSSLCIELRVIHEYKFVYIPVLY